MSKQIHFFATKEDMLNIVKQIEEQIKLKYAKLGSHQTQDIKTLNSLIEYSNLGINFSGNHLDIGFLVLDRNETLQIETVVLKTGDTNYHIDQKLNPNSIIIWLSGIYKNEYLICGHMGTVYDTTNRLYNVFQKYIKKQCVKKIGSYFVGNEALKLYGKLRFITINTTQSETYDLKIN